MRKYFLLIIPVVILISITIVAIFGSKAVLAEADKMTICHATDNSTNPFVKIVVSTNSGNGHLNTDGTPRAGHENDILFSGDVDCPGATPSPTSSALIASSPSPTSSLSPSLSPSPTPSPTPSLTPTPSPTTATTTTTTTNTTNTVAGAAAVSTPAPAVLGAQALQGQVLGASALAPTGTFDELLSLGLKMLGVIISGLGIVGYVKDSRF